MAMNLSTLPFENKLRYFISEKTGVNPSDSLMHDITCALVDYANSSNDTVIKERDYYKKYYFRMLDEKRRPQ